MKRILFTIFVTLLCLPSFGYDFLADGIYYNVLSEEDKTCEVTSSDGQYSGCIEIPQSASGYSVINIGNNAFDNCKNLTSILYLKV